MNAQKTIIILGGGTGGIVAANELSKKAHKKAKIILIDKNDKHVYAPSFLSLMLGEREAKNIQKPLSLLAQKGIEFVNDEIESIDPIGKTVKAKHQNFQYDYLIIALGADIAPDKMPGLAQSGYNLYELNEVERLRNDLKNFTDGRLAIVISSLPFKCPAAPYEAAFLLEHYFQKKGVRDKIKINIFTPEPYPMPAAGKANGEIVKKILEERNIIFHPEVQLVSVDPNKKELLFNGDRKENFDFLIYIPPHEGAKAVKTSGIGNEIGWIPVNAKTLKTKYENVYAIGDSTVITLDSGKPLPKAGVFAHFEASVVAENIASEIKGVHLEREYDGRAYCFLELGYGKSGFASGNFYAKPAPRVIMKKPSIVWHLGKMLFEKYWLWKWF